MSNFKLLAIDELKRFEKLKRYRVHARRAIKDLQRIAEMWKQIALKEMSECSRWRAEYSLELHKRCELEKAIEATKEGK